MQEIRPYTDKTSLIIDLQLYLSYKKGTDLNLSLLPKIASGRWPWMVSRWDLNLYRKFFEIARNDEYLFNALEVLNSHVNSWREGSNVNPFHDASIFADSFELLQSISFESILPTSAENIHAANELKRVSEFTESHFREMLKFIKNGRDLASDYIGLSDAVYDKYRKRSSGPSQRSFFVTDLYVLSDSIEMERFIEGLIFDVRKNRDVEPNLLAFANENLLQGNSQVGVLDIFNSYFLVPFEQSLEQMARDYLGDVNNWFELVSVNKLKPPYVDLYGSKLYILENATGNVIRVPSSDIEKYQIGMSVKIGSRLVPDEIRKVENVVDNNDGSAIVTLSGDQDLTKLKASEQAYLRVYSPDTLRDFSFVKIPVSAVSSYRDLPEPTLKVLKDLDKALYAFGVDLARDDKTGDLVLAPNNDLAFVYGVQAVRSAVINLMRTEQGELPLHPEYGIPTVVGFAHQGADSSARIASIIENAISRDPRFTSVDIIDIVISAEGEISISVNVSIAGVDQIIPLAFVV